MGKQSCVSPIYITPQNLIEFWSVATRPEANNGLGLTPDVAEAKIADFERWLPLAPDNQEVFPAWRNLVRQHGIIGLKVYDARLVAAMKVHGMTHILTFNGDDFKRYPDITVVDPATVEAKAKDADDAKDADVTSGL